MNAYAAFDALHAAAPTGLRGWLDTHKRQVTRYCALLRASRIPIEVDVPANALSKAWRGSKKEGVAIMVRLPNGGLREYAVTPEGGYSDRYSPTFRDFDGDIPGSVYWLDASGRAVDRPVEGVLLGVGTTRAARHFETPFVGDQPVDPGVTSTPDEPKAPNAYQIAVLRTIADAGGRVEPEAGGYWRTPDRRPFPPLPSARPGSKPYDWVSSNTIYSLVKKGLLARTHEAPDYYRDPCVLTDAARALFRPPPAPPAGDSGWQLVDDGDWAIWRKRMGSQTFWALARRTTGEVWTDRETLSRSYTKFADARAARATIESLA